jgi:hypothetical protein
LEYYRSRDRSETLIVELIFLLDFLVSIDVVLRHFPFSTFNTGTVNNIIQVPSKFAELVGFRGKTTLMKFSDRLDLQKGTSVYNTESD